MNSRSYFLAALFGLAPVSPVSAQTGDAAYCQALVDVYQHYLSGYGSGRRSFVDQNASARVAIDKCHAGDFSGIPVLEQELRNAKLELPSRS